LIVYALGFDIIFHNLLFLVQFFNARVFSVDFALKMSSVSVGFVLLGAVGCDISMLPMFLVERTHAKMQPQSLVVAFKLAAAIANIRTFL
jgi:hypothetical protein